MFASLSSHLCAVPHGGDTVQFVTTDTQPRLVLAFADVITADQSGIDMDDGRQSMPIMAP